ncbi:N-acetylmuramoyl-L-alanine amidase [Pseudidiomarina mangrovi]|uniref:N-acetylmuramoyl-L-alanine amidase n=1 Tax=Pseudidiomarina mangrovi TaxID=2487133 RepID=UPI000FCB01C9|nr:N-acetylmuramoyl-L-alanine amidase [Pseudidiomarina mangrovi]
MNQRSLGLLICLLLLLALSPAWGSTSIAAVRVGPEPDKTRVVFDLSAAPDYSYFTIDDNLPHRLVIDFKATQLAVNLASVPTESLLINKLRTSTPATKGGTRVVFELAQKLTPTLFVLPPGDGFGHRLVVDLPGQSVKRSEQALSVDQLQERKVTIAIDAGHGGNDPGSIGPTGLQEKRVVLSVAKALADMINADPGMQAYLIRTGDYYVGLRGRSRKAEEINADLLISIHADAFTSPQPRGASVWVLSTRRANTELGRLLEDKERLGDVLAGIDSSETDQDNQLQRILAGVQLDGIMTIGFEAAQEVVSELGKITRLHKREPQHASFAVLTAGNVPSMLVETGFISNPDEEKLLASNKHQQQLARAIYNGVRAHFTRKPPDGTLFATSRSMEHVVKRGESLSVIAKRYNTSVAAIKQHNNLKSDTVRIGQKLQIPSSR